MMSKTSNTNIIRDLFEKAIMLIEKDGSLTPYQINDIYYKA